MAHSNKITPSKEQQTKPEFKKQTVEALILQLSDYGHTKEEEAEYERKKEEFSLMEKKALNNHLLSGNPISFEEAKSKMDDDSLELLTFRSGYSLARLFVTFRRVPLMRELLNIYLNHMKAINTINYSIKYLSNSELLDLDIYNIKIIDIILNALSNNISLQYFPDYVLKIYSDINNKPVPVVPSRKYRKKRELPFPDQPSNSHKNRAKVQLGARFNRQLVEAIKVAASRSNQTVTEWMNERLLNSIICEHHDLADKLDYEELLEFEPSFYK